MRISTLLILSLFPISAIGKSAPHAGIDVDMSATKKPVVEKPVGVNLFMLMDHDDAQYRKVPMWKAMQNLGVKSIRFNEGEYGDWYLFTHPDSLHLLSHPGAPLYPYLIDIKSRGIDRQLTDINAPSYPGYALNRAGYRQTIDFNDFMEMCCKSGADDPTIIIPTHPMDRTLAKAFYPSREDMVKMAAAWVDYANNICKSGFRFWEIGNEHYWENNDDAYDVEWALHCSDMILDMAKAMKERDPSIEIGINGFTQEWLGAMLKYERDGERLIDYVDNIVPHQYAKPEIIGTYDKYLAAGEYGLHEVDEAVKALNEANVPDKEKLSSMKIQVTETSAFMAGTPSHKVNNVAWVALANFEHLGYVISTPYVEYAHFWATHWTDDVVYWSALKMDNTIAPMGWGVKLWNDNLLDNIWKADLSDNRVRCYASSSADNSLLTLFIVNKSQNKQLCEVNISGFEGNTSAEALYISADSPDADSFDQGRSTVSYTAPGRIFVKLKPLSVTVVKLGN